MHCVIKLNVLYPEKKKNKKQYKIIEKQKLAELLLLLYHNKRKLNCDNFFVKKKFTHLMNITVIPFKTVKY